MGGGDRAAWNASLGGVQERGMALDPASMPRRPDALRGRRSQPRLAAPIAL